MLKSYIHKSLISHVLNHVIGIIIFAVFIFVVVKYQALIGIKNQYDIIHSPSDALLFASIFLILLVMLIQARKGYLLYIPSTYLSFGSTGISFKRFKKEYRFVKWEDIEAIDLKIESEWLLNLHIKTKSEGSIRVELTELWILSITRKCCVNYNFLKLAAIANENTTLKEKLNQEQMEDMYNYSGVK